MALNLVARMASVYPSINVKWPSGLKYRLMNKQSCFCLDSAEVTESKFHVDAFHVPVLRLNQIRLKILRHLYSSHIKPKVFFT